MKKKVVMMIILILSFGSFGIVQANDSLFLDIENHWAKESIIEFYQDGIVCGYLDNTFRPDNEVTIAEFLKMVILAGKYKLLRNGNKVWPDFYIYTALSENLIMEGEFEEYLRPITRYEAIEIMSRLIDLSDVQKGKNIYQDVDEEHKEKVLKLSKLKIINGYSDKTFRGENSITRAETVTIIQRAMLEKKQIDIQKEYRVEQRGDLSNYYIESNSINPMYEIDGDKSLKIYDNGRYATLQGYTISNKMISVKKVVQMIKTLICENSYTEVLYIPSSYTVNQLRILYGESIDKIENGGFDFSFTYYEDAPYELSRISMEDGFSKECYLKIEVLKLWDTYSNYLKGVYVSEFKKQKLYDILKIEFGRENATNILKYILQKNELYVSGESKGDYYAETKKVGNYMINFYQTENSIPKFYISKTK